MKKAIIGILMTLIISCTYSVLKAQPDPGSGGGGSPVGGGAPVGSGIISLICLGVSYGIFRLYKQNKEYKE